MQKPKLIYYNDSRHYLMYRYDPPMSLHQLRQPVDEILGTGVDLISYGLASGHTFLHDSRVGLKWGEKSKEHNSGVMWWRAAENLLCALKAGYDPLKVVVDRAHEKGVRVMASLRINEGSPPTGQNLYMVGKLKYEKPEVMIGEADTDNSGAAGAYDFARPEVRQERLAVIEEVCDRYEADGLEIDDYVRVFFKRDEVETNTSLLTDFVREVRELLDRIGKKRDQQLYLAARVHPVEAANLDIGMDVRTWLAEKLVNLVIPSSGGAESSFVDSNPMAQWLIESAHAAGAWVYMPTSKVPYDDRNHVQTVEMIRAAAATHHAIGADGLYMADLSWPHTEREYQILREMGDPDIYARKKKHYTLGPKAPKKTPHQLQRYLPVTLEQGRAVRMPLFIGDALGRALADGELERVTLGFRVVQTCPEDRLRFRFNGQDLSVAEAQVRTYYGGIVSYGASRGGLPARIDTHYWFHFDLPLSLPREGGNEVEVTMEKHFTALTASRVLQSVELHISYKRPPVPVGGQM